MYNKMTRMIAQGERAEIPPAVIQQKMLELTASTKYKLDKVEQLVREATDAERKVIVFATRLSTLRFIHERLNKFGLVWITGKVSTVAPQGKRSERQLRVDAFQNDPKKRVLIATQQSCRVGLTLTAASVIVRVAREWNPSDNEQAVARIDRAGQTSAMDIYDLYAVLPDGTDTVERTHVKRALDMKSRRADGIIKGQHSRDKPD
jgi:SNF2 family DNA or RNA helicase